MAKPKKQETDSVTVQAVSVQAVSVFDDPPRKNVLLLSCMDQRLLDETVRFMNAMNLHNRYDQVALAGAAMGVLQLPKPELPKEKRWQGVFEAHLAAAINNLDRPIKDLFLLDHLDCGAYKYLHPDLKTQAKYKAASLSEMMPLHQAELKCLAAELKEFIACQRRTAENEFNAAYDSCQIHDSNKPGETENPCWKYVAEVARKKADAWSNIRVSYFVMDLLGNVQQLDVLPGESNTLPSQPKVFS